MNKDMSKRFDDRFELESQGCSECGGYELIDKTEKRYPKGKYYCEQDLEKIKSFIQSEIDLAVAEDRKKIDACYRMSLTHLPSKHRQSALRVFEKLIQLIEQK